MKILELRVLRGPNLWSVKKHRLIQMHLDIDELEFLPTNKISRFLERLKQLLPGLYRHRCSEGVEGGFFRRVEEGTWMGHVVEHIALEIQTMAGMENGFGRTRSSGDLGKYHTVFSYSDEEAGLYAGRTAVQIAEALVAGVYYNLESDISHLKNLWEQNRFGPSTGSIVEEALKRNIPFIRLDRGSLVQLGYGAEQKRIDATLTSTTSTIATDLACNKKATKQVLLESFVPVPAGEIISDMDGVKRVIDKIGYPIVIKPCNGNHGNGITVNISNFREAESALERARSFSNEFICEKFIEGRDFRVLIINHKFIAASHRLTASVIGNGINSIKELIDIINADPKRGTCHENILTRIKIDPVTLEILAKNNLSPDSVLVDGREICLKHAANISTGGVATDVTDHVHEANKKLFERISRVIGLDVCGIDIIAANLSTPLKDNGGVVLEVNAAPGFRMHLQPNNGKPRDVAKPVVDMLFPVDDGRIPIIAVTGTNGKTTTCRLIAAMCKKAGYRVGLTTTDGIYMEDEWIFKGDCAGPRSAQVVLKNPGIDFAVFECARGGILREGLGFDKCNTAVITNVGEDHLGLDGIDTIEKMAHVKSVVAECVLPGGYVILNADDDLVYKMKERLDCKIALFSLRADNERIQIHENDGGLCCVYNREEILLRDGVQVKKLMSVDHLPISFFGKAEFNISNALAAILAAYTSGISFEVINATLQEFIPGIYTTPGRMNFIDFPGFKVLIDYAHNPHALAALGRFIHGVDMVQKIGVIAGIGDRRDEDIIALGYEAAKIFDQIIIKQDKDMRGRTEVEIRDLLEQGIKKENAFLPVSYFLYERDAVLHAIKHAAENSLITILTENITEVLAVVQSQLMQCENNIQVVG